MVQPLKDFDSKGTPMSSESVGKQKQKCNICSKAFWSNENLNNHMLDHLNYKPYSCDICSNQFGREDELERHYLSHFENDHQVYRDDSDKGQSKKNYRKCTICSKSLKTRSSLKRHMSIHYGLKPFSCELCSKAFNRSDKLVQHLQTHFKGYGLSKADLTSMSADTLRQQFEPIIKDSKSYKCDICSKVYTKQNHLNNHMVTHSDVRPFTCGVCFKAYKRRDNLKNHFRTIHDGVSETYMEVPLSASMLPQQEIYVTDIKETKFKCEICSKGFTTKLNISVHMMIHSGLKPFSCEICLKAFRARGQLKKHARMHSNQERLIKIYIKLKKCYVKLKKLNQSFQIYNKMYHLQSHLNRISESM